MPPLIPVKTQYSRWTGSFFLFYTIANSFTWFLACFGHSSKLITWSCSYHSVVTIQLSSSTEISSHPPHPQLLSTQGEKCNIILYHISFLTFQIWTSCNGSLRVLFIWLLAIGFWGWWALKMKLNTMQPTIYCLQVKWALEQQLH